MRIPPRLTLTDLTFENYRIFYETGQLFRWTMNTVIISTAAIALSIGGTSMAAYSFSAYQFRGKALIYWCFLAALMIPGQSMFIPKFVLMRHLRLIDTWWSLILGGGCSPVGIIIFMKFFNKIPSAFADSARIDGLGEFPILFKIMLPQCMPLIGYLIITGYMASFKAFLWPFMMLSTPNKQTLMVGITRWIRITMWLKALHNQSIGLELAGGVIMFIPILIIFLTFQRTFRQEFIAGGIKE